MYPVPSFFTEEKMPYFHVEISTSDTIQFVVNAPDQESAEDLAIKAGSSGDMRDRKHIVKLNAQRQTIVSISETDKAAWTDTVKKAKAK